MRTSAALTLALVALAGVSGCGSDDEESRATPTAPELTVPGGDETVEAAPTQTAPAPAPAPEPPQVDTSGESPAPPATQPQDSPEHDTPPPPNSPAERFEKFCDANPGACG